MNEEQRDMMLDDVISVFRTYNCPKEDIVSACLNIVQASFELEVENNN